jgi:hypothetical protein
MIYISEISGVVPGGRYIDEVIVIAFSLLKKLIEVIRCQDSEGLPRCLTENWIAYGHEACANI